MTHLLANMHHWAVWDTITSVFLNAIRFYVIFGAAFLVMEWLAPARRVSWEEYKRAFTLDGMNALLNAPFNRIVAFGNNAMLAAVLAELPLGGLEGAREVVRGWPLLAQIFVVALLEDFTTYWIHRLSHGKYLWPLHAMHHASSPLTWSAGFRGHPLLIPFDVSIIRATLFFFISPAAAAGYMAFAAFQNVYNHANVAVHYGWFNRIFVSPLVHHWHHRLQYDGKGINFAVIFSFYDVLFGTFYLPEDNAFPADVGVDDTKMGETLWSQLTYPVNRSAKDN